MTTRIFRDESRLRCLSLGFLFEHLHGHGDQPVQLIVRRPGQQRLGPQVVLAGGVAVEQAAQERHQCDTLELRSTPRILTVIVRAEQRLESVCIAQRLGRERRDHLTESDITLRERLRFPFGPQEDCADDRGTPSNRDDHDRAHVPHIECGPRVLQHRVVRRVRDEDRVPGFERALELGVAIQVDHEVPDRRILVTGHESDVGVAAGEVDGAAIEPERLSELAGDRLQNVYEMERGRDVLQDVDDGDELITLSLQLRDLLLQPGGLRSRWGITFDR